MNRIEGLVAVLEDSARSESEKTIARNALNDIAASNSVDAKEREAARRAIGRGSLDDLLGLSSRPKPAPANESPTATPTPAKSSEAAAPVTPEPPPVSKERSEQLSRLDQVLAGAPTSIKEISELLEPKTKQALDYTKEMKLKRLRENLMLTERREHSAEQEFHERYQPIVIGNHKFRIDPAVRATIVAIRDDGAYVIRNCTRHRQVRCKCFWENVRPKLLAFRDKHGPASDEYKVANVIWDELESLARNHVPRRNQPMRTEALEDSPNPEWLGRRKL